MTKMTRISAIAASTALIFTGFAPAMAAPMSSVAAVATPLDTGPLGWSADVAGQKLLESGTRGFRALEIVISVLVAKICAVLVVKT